LYYDPAKPTAFSTLNKLAAAVVKTKKNEKNLGAWLEKQDSYTFHRPIRRRFARNPYSVSNVIDVWECDLVDIQALAKFNDKSKKFYPSLTYFPNFYI